MLAAAEVHHGGRDVVQDRAPGGARPVDQADDAVDRVVSEGVRDGIGVEHRPGEFELVGARAHRVDGVSQPWVCAECGCLRG